MDWLEYTDPTWRNLNMTELDINEAFIFFTSYLNSSIWIYDLLSYCVQCPYSIVEEREPYSEKEFIVNVKRPISFKIFDRFQGKYALSNQSALCTIEEPSLGQFGVYNLTLFENSTCELVQDKKPVDIYKSIIFVVIVMALFCVLWKISIAPFQKYRKRESNRRLLSIDVFRGGIIILMIFVNSSPKKYWWLGHTHWHGLYVADYVFPLFIWIMGVCIPFSINGQLKREISKYAIIKGVVKRGFMMCLIEISLTTNFNSKPIDFHKLRLAGVLVRAGTAYLVCAIFYLFSKTNFNFDEKKKSYRLYGDLILMKIQFIFSFILIIIYLIITLGIPRPGCPRGYFGPGGKHNNAKYFNCTGGITMYFDNIESVDPHLLTNIVHHLYDGSIIDPEGIFGHLMTIVHVFLGVHFGVILGMYSDFRAKTIRLILNGTVLLIIAGSLCGFSFEMESGLIPINKYLWSLSFVCYTSGISLFLLLALYCIVDVYKLWNGFPFVEVGMNSIGLYIGHRLAWFMFPFHFNIGLMNTHFKNLLMSCWNTFLWIIIAIYFYNKRIFISL